MRSLTPAPSLGSCSGLFRLYPHKELTHQVRSANRGDASHSSRVEHRTPRLIDHTSHRINKSIAKVTRGIPLGRIPSDPETNQKYYKIQFLWEIW